MSWWKSAIIDYGKGVSLNMGLARVSQECFMEEVTVEILNPEFQILALHFLTG